MSEIILDLGGPLTGERIVRETRRHLSKGRVLDIGTGKGALVSVFRSYGYEAFGFDERKVFEKEIKKYCFTGDAFKMPVADESFEGVTESLMIAQGFEIENWLGIQYSRLFTEIYRVMVPGGVFVSSWIGKAANIPAWAYDRVKRYSGQVGLEPVRSRDRGILVYRKPLGP